MVLLRPLYRNWSLKIPNCLKFILMLLKCLTPFIFCLYFVWCVNTLLSITYLLFSVYSQLVHRVCKWNFVLLSLQANSSHDQCVKMVGINLIEICTKLRPVYTYLHHRRLHVCHRQSLTLCQWKWTVWWADWVQTPFSPSNSPSLFTQCKFDGHAHGDGTCKKVLTWWAIVLMWKECTED